MNTLTALVIGILGCATATSALAEPVDVNVVLAPTETIRMNFADGSQHFVALVRRDGVAEATGVFDGARVVEYGWHDINPAEGGNPLGYLELTNSNGDIAYLRWQVRAVFMGGKKGPPVVHGTWELVSGTGEFAQMRGLGALQIGPGAGPDRPERRYSLRGQIVPR
ncbi:MAG: hypothetical protein GY788_23315 [bacterium]|nr:hypothetical protein [bacterium]